MPVQSKELLKNEEIIVTQAMQLSHVGVSVSLVSNNFVDNPSLRY